MLLYIYVMFKKTAIVTRVARVMCFKFGSDARFRILLCYKNVLSTLIKQIIITNVFILNSPLNENKSVDELGISRG
jgi:hypothetical protein